MKHQLPESKLRLFLSVDVIGSTLFKSKHTYTATDHEHPWLYFFRDFYDEFPTHFLNELDNEEILEQEKPILWKSMGDELIFYSSISQITTIPSIITGFKNALEKYDEESLEQEPNLGLKATAWIAGFPVINAEVSYEKNLDFIGPSIDIGFRLCKFATKRKFIVSVELAYLLLQSDTERETRKGFKPKFTYFFDGLKELKGVLDGKPYPIVWIDMRDGTAPIEEELMGYPKSKATIAQLRDYCKQFINSVNEHLMIVPYVIGKAPVPESHKNILNNIAKSKAGSFDENPQAALEDVSDPSSEQDLDNILKKPVKTKKTKTQSKKPRRSRKTKKRK